MLFSASTKTIMWFLSYLMLININIKINITLILHLLNHPCDAGVNLTWSWCMILFLLLDLANVLSSGFELITKFVYVAGPGFSCGLQDLHCSTRTPQLWPTGSGAPALCWHHTGCGAPALCWCHMGSGRAALALGKWASVIVAHGWVALGNAGS